MNEKKKKLTISKPHLRKAGTRFPRVSQQLFEVNTCAKHNWMVYQKRGNTISSGLPRSKWPFTDWRVWGPASEVKNKTR